MATQTTPGGNIYDPLNGVKQDEQTALNRDARDLATAAVAAGAADDATNALQTANSYAGQIAQANTTAGEAKAIAQGAEDTADNAESRVDALEVMGGVQPGSVNDAEMKLHAEQEGGLFNTALNAQIEEGRIAPVMTVHDKVAEPIRVLWQDQETMYAYDLAGSGMIRKSTNAGQDWTDRGSPSMGPLALVVVEGTGTLIAVESTRGDLPDQNPRIKRSTDDGATWTEVAVVGYPGLGHCSLISPAPGVILHAEYGNIGDTVYRVRRSADDGVTWQTVLSSPGTDPVWDPGHFHSITVDPYSGQIIAYMDRPTGAIYQSTDGATWTKIADVVQEYHPNFVEPMYFPDHIAWGVDNGANGKVFRLPRADFYAGNWEDPELVVQLNEKVFYETFPIRPGVWIMMGAAETIGRSDKGIGSYFNEVYIVDQGGSRVSGGVAWAKLSRYPGTMANGGRSTPPGYPVLRPWQNGLTWLRFTDDANRYASAPVTVGIAPQMPQIQGPVDGQVVPYGRGYMVRGLDGEPVMIAGPDANNDIEFRGLLNPATRHRIKRPMVDEPNGFHEFLVNGSASFQVFGLGAVIPHDRVLRLTGASGEVTIRKGLGAPPAGLNEPVGSLYLQTNPTTPDNTLWIRVQVGAAAFDWQPVGARPSVYSSVLTNAAAPINTSGKYEGREVWCTSTKQPLYADGATPTSPWLDATGATRFTPA